MKGVAHSDEPIEDYHLNVQLPLSFAELYSESQLIVQPKTLLFRFTLTALSGTQLFLVTKL